jgi:hypothetical protein
MVEVVQRLRWHGIASYVEQTGGGCATIYVGTARQRRDGEWLGMPSFRAEYPVIAGPGVYDWDHGGHEAYYADFYIGIDDQGVGPPGYSTTEADTTRTVTNEIVRVYRAQMAAWVPLREDRIVAALDYARSVNLLVFLRSADEYLAGWIANPVTLTVEESEEVLFRAVNEVLDDPIGALR